MAGRGHSDSKISEFTATDDDTCGDTDGFFFFIIFSRNHCGFFSFFFHHQLLFMVSEVGCRLLSPPGLSKGH